MDSKGQGAIEYLLIIGAAVIIAVIVIALMMSLSQQGTGAAKDAGLEDTFEKAQCQKDCGFLGTEPDPADATKTINICSKYSDIC